MEAEDDGQLRRVLSRAALFLRSPFRITYATNAMAVISLGYLYVILCYLPFELYRSTTPYHPRTISIHLVSLSELERAPSARKGKLLAWRESIPS